ncbi:TetR/AcrR family transcriptional regulator [soil metagenome]
MRAPSASPDKRAELVGAAKRLLHRQGFHRTTLADVAADAKVPLGNVYYYFKTKEALAEAVILAHEDALCGRFAEWTNAHTDPQKRLRCLVRAPLDASDSVIQFGCPHGSLCQELEKLGEGAPLARASSRLLSVYVTWVETQFRELGAGRESRALALQLVAAIQGTMLLASTLRSPELLSRQLRRIERTLDDSRRQE